MAAGIPRHQRVRFNSPGPVGRELEFVQEAMAGRHLSANGPFTRSVSAMLAEDLGAADVLLTTSCTDALEMAAMLLGIQPGDVVIVPSFTFVSTALAFVRAGATVRFADIERSTLGLDPESIEPLLDDDVKAIVPVHYAGVGCDMDAISSLADERGIQIVEDNAHGLFGRLGDRALGSMGRFSTVSFHETKNFQCGEGGALVVNDPADVDRAHVLLHKGTNRRAFERDEVRRYSWVDTGSSFGLSDLLAAHLLGQLERREWILSRRSEIWHLYDELLAPLEVAADLDRMQIAAGRRCAWHLYYVLVPEAAMRPALIEHLDRAGIDSAFHYVPLHTSAGASTFGEANRDLPVTDDVAGRLLRLPFHNELRRDDVERVVSAVSSFFA